MNANGDAIQYGMFIMPFHMNGKPLAQCHDEDLELVVRAEELGFSEFWIGEHHTMKYETIEIILKLWSTDPPYEFHGKFWNIDLKKYVDVETGIGYIPKPLQQPHPPVAVPAMTGPSYSAQIAGRRGFAPFASPLMAGNVAGQMYKTYENAALAAGRQPDRRK